MTIIEVEKTIKVQANVNTDIAVAEYSGQFYAITDNTLGAELSKTEIAERIVNFARVKYGVVLMDTEAEKSVESEETED